MQGGDTVNLRDYGLVDHIVLHALGIRHDDRAGVPKAGVLPVRQHALAHPDEFVLFRRMRLFLLNVHVDGHLLDAHHAVLCGEAVGMEAEVLAHTCDNCFVDPTVETRGGQVAVAVGLDVDRGHGGEAGNELWYL